MNVITASNMNDTCRDNVTQVVKNDSCEIIGNEEIMKDDMIRQ